jgi:ribosome-associated protein
VDSLQKSLHVTLAALERNALDPVLLDVREVTSFADTVVLLAGGSDRQVRAIADGIIKLLQDEGEPALGVEGLDEGRWVLIDCNDVIAHVFLSEVRDLYDLERLWSDAPIIDLVGLGVPQEALAQARSEETPPAESRR